jgi:hypothetical protein
MATLTFFMTFLQLFVLSTAILHFGLCPKSKLDTAFANGGLFFLGKFDVVPLWQGLEELEWIEWKFGNIDARLPCRSSFGPRVLDASKREGAGFPDVLGISPSTPGGGSSSC